MNKLLRRFFLPSLAVGLFDRPPAQAQRLETTIKAFEAREVFFNQSQTFQLSTVPVLNLPVKVFLNGLLMLEDRDFVLDGKQLTFVPGQVVGVSAIVQVFYWRF